MISLRCRQNLVVHGKEIICCYTCNKNLLIGYYIRLVASSHFSPGCSEDNGCSLKRSPRRSWEIFREALVAGPAEKGADDPLRTLGSLLQVTDAEDNFGWGVMLWNLGFWCITFLKLWKTRKQNHLSGNFSNMYVNLIVNLSVWLYVYAFPKCKFLPANTELPEHITNYCIRLLISQFHEGLGLHRVLPKWIFYNL